MSHSLPAGDCTIDVRDLYKSYRRGNTNTLVLQAVNFYARSGECVFLLGPSGCGKTTLLSILGCILTPDSGQVSVLGKDVARLDQAERARFRRDRIGFVFQRFHLIRGLTAVENVAVPLALRGTPPAQAQRRAKQMLASVGLGERANSLSKQLSTGQCQRVAVARALAADGELILADEPTASLDADNGRELMDLLRNLTTHYGKTLVVVTHDQRILSYADRVCEIEDGRVKEACQVTENEALAPS